MSNSIGRLFRVTSFGESHGPVVGVVVDGCPAGLSVDQGTIQRDLDRRRAVGQAGATPRREADAVRILSGMYEGCTTGAPVCMVIDNANVESSNYLPYPRTPRPGHADFTAKIRYGGFNDPRGGGRFSGRITAGFVMAGALARAALGRIGVEVHAHTVAIGEVEAPVCEPTRVRELNRRNALSCCDDRSAESMVQHISEAEARGDSVGGVVECVVLGLPPGVGEPVFSGLESEISHAVFSIPAVKGIEFGGGFALSRLHGSAANDPYEFCGDSVRSVKNDSGGILGGLSTGMPLVLRAAFKPTPSISLPQQTVDLEERTTAELIVRGRHDACIVPRGVVVVESMVACVLCDLCLRRGLIPGVMV